MPGVGTAHLGGKWQHQRFKEGLAHSRRLRNGRLTPGSLRPNECTLSPSHGTMWNAETAHMVFKVCLLLTTPISTTKKLAFVRPPPLGVTGKRSC